MTENLLCAAAPGKINLFLKITGRRSNGYHELESLFLPLADPADDIAIDLEALPGAITVGSSDIMLPCGINNIAGRAAELWSRRSGVMPHWDINIKKNIPVAAGMGGGSSDAAAVLKLLNEHANCPLNTNELAQAALELGADVPYFLDPRPAVMTGIGEKAEPLDFEIPDLNLLLLSPDFPVSAAEGYRLLDKKLIAPPDASYRTDIIKSLRSGDLEKLSGLLTNDLQAGVFNKYPVLEILKQSLESTGALTVLMTGSGPTLFAIYPDHTSRETARVELQARFPEYRLTAARQLRSF